ncbi:MAG: hypothetical protein A3F46_08545 [Legionellales bacterium RIFCSPHIGHO2_12_FULL_42_9]|nr:MAG: hypothetical protein A3F46_08545 [Legionellales bacterium RIFCSPHIGHO2_12_FULL_42_9]
MYIHLEAHDQHAIEAYSEHDVRINAVTYQQNIIVSQAALITGWHIKSIVELNEHTLAPFLNNQAEIILIGHTEPNIFSPSEAIQFLAEHHIALECMPIGSACRTFNVLLSEKRNVVLGIILGVSEI